MIDWSALIQDGLFAAMAAIGFSSISHTPTRAYTVCGLAAALGHASRFMMMHTDSLMGNIIIASTLAALIVGITAVILSPYIKVPAESCLYPALLPMIPGMYAYRTITALMHCITDVGEPAVLHNLYLLCFNGFTCVAIVIGMVIGANLPIYLLKHISFQATR
ncbi:MAG: threonine/serine exporter family protein [Muribaculaceae bacterium]|nr:threonine/serine exporter family protein [Muribaculaceae bacterium]